MLPSQMEDKKKALKDGGPILRGGGVGGCKVYISFSTLKISMLL